MNSNILLYNLKNNISPINKKMSDANNNLITLDHFSTVKSLQNENDKNIIISKLNLELKKLTTEVNRLSKENSDLKIKYSLNHDVQMRLQNAEDTISDLREKNLKLILEHKNKESELGQKINEILIEKKREKLNSERNETLCMQKMLIANQIELENKIYKEEVEQLKKQIEIMDGNSKNKIYELETNNLIKYNILKKKILNSLNETKMKLENLNLKYMDNNNRTTNLQNYQLLMELEAQKQENEQLIKENESLNKQLVEIKEELDIHQKVEFQLAEKIKKIRIKSNVIDNNTTKLFPSLSSLNIGHKNHMYNNLNDNMDIIYKKLKRIKVLNENEKIKMSENKGNKKGFNSTHKMNRTQNDYNVIHNKNLLFRERDFRDLKDISEISGNSKILSEDRFNKEINLVPDENFLLKLKNVTDEQKYINLFNFLERCLDNFYDDVKSHMKGTNKIKIDFESIKKLKFNEFSKKEQYILLILLMNHILPLIYVYFNSNSNNNINDNNLFKTDLNLNYKILNKIYGNSSNIIKRTFFGRDNKLSVELCMNKLGETIKKKNLSVFLLDKKPKI